MKTAHKAVMGLLAGVTFVLASASIAQGMIQVQRGISGVRLNMTPAQVKAGLGTPSKVRHGHNDFGPYTQYVYRGGITVSFQGNANVTAVQMTGHTDRTASGVGVGSTRQAVKNGVPGVKCGPNSCDVGKSTPGHRVTDFLFHNGRVSRVTIGFVID